MTGGSGATSAVNAANYTLNGSALPAGTSLIFKSTAQDIVDITLPANSIESSDSAAILRIANVTKSSGETMEPYTTTVAITDNIKPVLQSAVLIDNETIDLTFNENMAAVSSAQVGDEYTIKLDGTAVTLTAAELTATSVDGFAKKVRLTIAKDSTASAVTASAGGTMVAPTVTGYTRTTPTDYVVKVATVDGGTGAAATWAISSDGGVTYGAVGTATALAYGVTITAPSAASVDETFSFTVTPVVDTGKDITITTKTPVAAAIEDTAGNDQKVDVTVTVTK